jgi:CcmD family protein
MRNPMMTRVCLSLFVMAALAAGVFGPLTPAPLHAQQPQQQDEFVPIDQLPPQDQLPAAPLLVTAYSFVVLALFAYLISVARRLGVVQKELDRLQTDARRGRT